MSKWEDIVEKKIRDAMKDGAFDNLPGKGQPLNLEENPFEDPSMRMAHRMLRNNGFTLPWIEEKRELEAEIETARADLARSWARYVEAQSARRPTDDDGWEQALSLFRQRVVKLNRRISDYNLRAPSESFQRLPLDAERDIKRITQKQS